MIKKITIENSSCIKFIRNNIKQKYPKENGRGVEKWITKYLIPTIQKEIEPYLFPVSIRISKPPKESNIQIFVEGKLKSELKEL